MIDDLEGNQRMASDHHDMGTAFGRPVPFHTKTNADGTVEIIHRDPNSRPDQVEPFSPKQPQIRVIAPLHGIRTTASWQRTFSDVAQAQGWRCPLERWNYGRFSLLRFLKPFQRRTKINWFRNTYSDCIHYKSLPLYDDNLPSIVAHSFGTYIL